MSRRMLYLLFCYVLLSACSQTLVDLDTPNGQLQGYIDGEVEHYLGVPYASPPTGERRWRAPAPANPWRGKRDALQLPEMCAQTSLFNGALIGSEDCLYLNIWSPVKKPAQAMPVMVWFHGGGFILGQGSYTKRDGRLLALREDVVVVSINYRLGIFGFLAHEALDAENSTHPSSGNYGIEDQTAALRWVQENISAFGGDPQRVTIFGQSAGGVSVCTQLASPGAAGLFHRAIIQSGPCAVPLATHSAATQLGDKAQTLLDCDSSQHDVPQCLRSRSAEDVAATLPPDPTLGFGEDYTMWWPSLDPVVLPLPLTEAFSSGSFNQVPVIDGTTLNEASLLIWLSHNMRFKPLQADQYLDRLEHLTGSRESAEKVAQRYPLENYDSPFEAFTDAFSHGFFNCISRRQTLAMSGHVPVWTYRFDYQDAPFFIPWADLKAYHAAEMQYVFGNPMSLTRRHFKKKEQTLANSMMGYWAQFARSGNPNSPDASAWPAFNKAESSILFNLDNSVAEQVFEPECRFWDELPYLRPSYQ